MQAQSAPMPCKTEVHRLRGRQPLRQGDHSGGLSLCAQSILLRAKPLNAGAMQLHSLSCMTLANEIRTLLPACQMNSACPAVSACNHRSAVTSLRMCATAAMCCLQLVAFAAYELGRSKSLSTLPCGSLSFASSNLAMLCPNARLELLLFCPSPRTDANSSSTPFWRRCSL